MACYKPLTAWQREDGEVVFVERGRIQRQLTLACGQCIGCRLERSRQWAIRCIHEAKFHKHNCFVTLTYNTQNLPENGQLRKSDAVKFLKRLRQAAWRAATKNPLPTSELVGREGILTSRSTANRRSANDAPQEAVARRPLIRYYLAGEYGEQFGRPHFHICLFGIDFSDKHYLSKTGAGSKLYRSPTLEKLWTLGHSSIGELTFESAAYTARYIMKKINGNKQKEHYTKINPDTGEIYELTPEYNVMSRRPGIGLDWFQKFKNDAYPEGRVVIRGKKTNTPRYYDKQYAKLEPIKYEEMQFARHTEGVLHALDQTDERLAVKEKVTQAKIRQLARKL